MGAQGVFGCQVAASQGVWVQHAGFVFKNSVSKAILDAHPNPVLKLNGLEDQLKLIWGTMDHMQTNLFRIRAHGNMVAMKLLAKKAKGGGHCGD